MSDGLIKTDETCEHGRPDHHVLIRQLAEALGLELGAVPHSPKQVWNDLLQRVKQLREFRDSRGFVLEPGAND